MLQLEVLGSNAANPHGWTDDMLSKPHHILSKATFVLAARSANWECDACYFMNFPARCA